MSNDVNTSDKHIGEGDWLPSHSDQENRVANTISHSGNDHPYTTVLGIGLLVIVLVFSFIGWRAYTNAEQDAIAEGKKLAEETLALQIELLSGVLEKYRMLPPLMARQPKIHDLFNQALQLSTKANSLGPPFPLADPVAEQLRPELLELAHLSGAKDVAFYDLNGGLLISGRSLFRGNLANFSNDLLEAPLQGRLGRALVTSNGGVISYAFASVVKEAGTLLGIIVFYVDLEPIEQTWALSRLPIAVFDQNNNIVLSNQYELLGKNLESIRQLRGERIYFLLGQQWLRRVEAIKDIPRLKWRMEVISELPGLRERQNSALLSTLVLAIVIGIIYFFVVRRRESQYLSHRRVRDNAERLERLVKQRTRDLSDTNANLQQEVEERKQTEAKLVTTQKELVHAAKLAVIGQMSTTLSHEFNQPLAAVRTYAENAGKLQTMEKFESVAENLSRIIAQVDRMGDLSKTLMSFSRKPEAHSKPLPVRLCIDEALMLVMPRAKKLQVTIEDCTVGDDIWIMGVQVQVTQVLINIINNALDAVAGVGQTEPLLSGKAAGKVQLTCRQQHDIVTIEVHDNGPGIPLAQRETIFEPFFTTKASGFGLGIGLSVVSGIVKDLHGTISVSDSALGGALVTVTLVATHPP
jgi:two-component system C4-dicarboxylate transport sensor histidine kinase DctB